MGPTKITPEDQQFNISFVGEIKKHPCLFDSNSVEYKQAAVQDKSWHAVSSAMDESVDTCKKRWRNLRCCMTRYLKSVRDNSDLQQNLRRKPYYLYTHMQFVLPYLKVREEGTNYEHDESAWLKQNSSAAEEPTKPDDEEECEEEPHEMETMDVEEEDHEQQQLKDSIIQSIKILPLGQESTTHDHHDQHEALSASEAGETTTTYEIIHATPTKQARLNAHHTVESSGSAAGSPTQNTLENKKEMLAQRQFFAIAGNSGHSMPCFSANTLTQPQIPTFAQQNPLQTQTAQHFALIPSAPTIVSDADHNFFQSLVPDIQSMTLEQKRKLRIGILQLIDNILNT